MKYYAVKNGRQKGIFLTWEDCKEQVDGFEGAEYKSFNNIQDAEAYLINQQSEHTIVEGPVAYVDGSFKEETNEYSFAQLAMNTSISMENLKVVNIYTTDNQESSSNGAMTITCKVGDTTVVLRTVVLRDASGNLITFREYEGKTLNVKGMVDFYDGTYQIKVFNIADVTFNN